MELKNKNVVITGGGRGLGKSLAKALKEAGANVVIVSNSKETLEKTAEELGVKSMELDVRNEKDVQKTVEKIIEEFGQVDVWINNAGIWTDHQPIEDIDWHDDVHNIFEVNFFGLVYGSKAALLQMRKQGGGMIINILSTSALSGRFHSSSYCASKFAASGFTKSLKLEAEPDGIEVVGVYPGGMKTDLFRNNIPENYDEYMSSDEVAKKIVGNLSKDKPDEEQVIKRG